MDNNNRSPFPVRSLHILLVTSCEGHPFFDALQIEIEHLLSTMLNKVTLCCYSDLTVSKVIATKPDLVLLISSSVISHTLLNKIDLIREAGIITALWSMDDPYLLDHTVHWIHYFNYVFTTDYSCLELYKSYECNAYYLPLAAATCTYYPLEQPMHRKNDLCFIGCNFPNRATLIQTISAKLSTKRILVGGPYWQSGPHYELCSSWLTPKKINEFYNQTSIVLNLNRPVDFPGFNFNEHNKINPTCINPKTFEICAAGAFQLTDIREDLTKFYTPGIEIETYASTEELLEKINFYLVHEEKRKKIAQQALQRTLLEHTYAHRMDTMLRIIFT